MRRAAGEVTGHHSSRRLGLGLLAPTTVRVKFLLFEPPPFYGIFLRRPELTPTTAVPMAMQRIQTKAITFRISRFFFRDLFIYFSTHAPRASRGRGGVGGFGGGGKGGRGKESPAFSLLSTEPDTRLDPKTPRSEPQTKSRMFWTE